MAQWPSPRYASGSDHIASGPGAFSYFNSWRALANSSGKKSSKVHLSGGVGILQNGYTSLTTSLADLLFVVLYIPFLINYEAIELAVRKLSGSARQVVNYILCQPTGVREVDVIDSLGPAIFFVFHQDGTESESS